MPDLTIIYWRDIPAQVIVGKGRRGAKVKLDERFEKAIDRAAMKSGARDTDAYLAGWRRMKTTVCDGNANEIAAQKARSLEQAYDDARLNRLVSLGGS
ncbi:MAG: virulence factor, partial [Paracoccaceae bacterium]